MTKTKYKDPMGDRIKNNYENAYRITLPKRMPLILRLDGKAFHTLLKEANKPFDRTVIDAMIKGAEAVMKEIGGSTRFAYIQSDECTIAINNYMSLESEPWFDNNLQKICSVSASLMSVAFSQEFGKTAVFDCRAFVVPESEMNNTVLWRQFDASKNSISMYAQSMFNHKELHGKKSNEMQEMMFQNYGFNWDKAETWTKRGVIVKRTEEGLVTDWEIPKFSEDKDYLENIFYGYTVGDSSSPFYDFAKTVLSDLTK